MQELQLLAMRTLKLRRLLASHYFGYFMHYSGLVLQGMPRLPALSTSTANSYRQISMLCIINLKGHAAISSATFVKYACNSGDASSNTRLCI